MAACVLLESVLRAAAQGVALGEAVLGGAAEMRHGDDADGP
jgi:hypothetical protein